MLNITKKLQKINKVKFAIFIVFCLLSIVLTVLHQPWRDEAQAWLIARDSGGLSQIFKMMGYEGTPALWHLILYPFAAAGLPFGTMFVIHFLLNIVVVGLIIFKSPFNKLQTVLIIFGYYLLFEYNIIARNYILTFLGIIILAINFNKNLIGKNYLYSAIGLFILSWSSLFGFVISLCLLAAFFIFNFKNLSKNQRFLLIIFGIFIFISVALQLIPPSDLGFHGSVRNFNASQLFKEAGLSYGNAFWGNSTDFTNKTQVSVSLTDIIVCAICVGLCGVSSILSFGKRCKVLGFFLFFAFLLIGLFYILNVGVTDYRHCGIIFMIFVFLHWIFYSKSNNTRISEAALIFTLGIGVFVSAINLAFINQPFSNANNTYLFLKNNNYLTDNYFIGTNKGFSTTVISANLPSNIKIYHPDGNNYPTYITWNKNYYSGYILKFADLTKNFLDEFKKSSKTKAIYLVSVPFWNKLPLDTNYKVTKLASFTGSMKDDEDFDVYLIEK